MAVAATKTPGKTSFVKEVLIDNPHANPRAVNEAWTAAGMKGTISMALVNKMRARMGLSGNLRGKGRKAGAAEKRIYGPASPLPSARVAPKGLRSARDRAIYDLEGEIDRLLFKVMAMDGLADVAESLRTARRQLYMSARR
jgi:hypothetical protein